MNIKLTVIALALCSSVNAHAGPFGLEMGMTTNPIKGLTNLEPYWYLTKSVPNPHSNFVDYLLAITPQHGLCKIVALGKSIPMNVYGTELKSEFEYLKGVLTEKYGALKSYNDQDHLRTDSVWKKPDEWTRALKLKERFLAAVWIDTELPDNIRSIRIEAAAADFTTGIVNVTYEFNNAPECLNAVKRKQAASL